MNSGLSPTVCEQQNHGNAEAASEKAANLKTPI
jgi:hypothetical protein